MYGLAVCWYYAGHRLYGWLGSGLEQVRSALLTTVEGMLTPRGISYRPLILVDGSGEGSVLLMSESRVLMQVIFLSKTLAVVHGRMKSSEPEAEAYVVAHLRTRHFRTPAPPLGIPLQLYHHMYVCISRAMHCPASDALVNDSQARL